MFKCKECGTEYDTKPDFCDCGNDTFEEIAVPVQKAPVEEEQPAYKGTVQPPKQDVHPAQKNTDIISPLIFLFCITLAVIVLFFVGNPKQEDKLNSQKTEETPKQTINLPSIDSLWNNSTTGIINNEKSKTKQVVQKPEQQPIPVQPQPVQVAQIPVTPIVQKPQNVQQTTKPVAKSEPKKTQVQTVVQKPKQTTATQTKPAASTTTAKPAQQATSQKPAIPKTTQDIANGKNTSTTTTKPKTTQQTQTTTTKTTTTNNQTSTPKTTQTQTTTPKTTTQNTQTQTTATNIPTSTTIRPKTTVDTQALKKELNNYKIGLRNTIGRKIDFASVIGDGDCTVSFKVASNGKLTNRAFAKQSSNITLNDAVYSAVMSTPSYNPPPTGYNNETMNLHIRFYNGNFDISLN